VISSVRKKEEKMKTVTHASILVLLVAASSALAQEGPPKPAPEMANLKFYVGSWSCTGNSPAGPFGPAHKTQSTVNIKPDLDGFWYDGMMMEMKTASNPHPVRGMLHLGYDTTAKQYVTVWLDNFGSWATEMSQGWEGDTMTWTGDQNVMGEKASARDVFTKKGNNQFTHRFELTMKGQSNLIVDETCKRKK
jgi:uncharacterized protein DUF1579